MAVEIVEDSVEDIKCREENGVIVELVRRFKVKGAAGADWGRIANAMANSSIPQAFSSPIGNSNLIVVERTAEVLESAPDITVVTLIYRPIGFSGSGNGYTQFKVRGKANLSQIQTQFDRLGNQATVSHTFPSTDPDYGGLGQITQGVNLTVDEPQMVISLEGALFTAWPEQIAASWINHINADTWLGALPGYWLCTDVDFELRNIEGFASNVFVPLWDFRFDFQLAARPWQPLGVFVDPRTGQPPAGLVPDVGVKQFETYPYRFFSLGFPL